ncbi:MAG TPA: DegT/DnrJ/EryC1/StrS family aminotransferase, partial [Candidatus Krumholzibacteria bacterium]|nr:DegT/DnrJ/EryC1/StrS family aminotransferase [Candidatus Krumholzibacteria bacterium]
AAIGIHQLKRVEANWLRRKEIWDRYNEAFAQLPIGTPSDPDEDTRHAFHLYTIMVAKGRSGIGRDDFLTSIQAQGVGVGVHYLSIPEHPYYQQHFGWRPEEYPAAMRIGRETVSLPLSPKLTNQDAADVIEAVRRVVEG